MMLTVGASALSPVGGDMVRTPNGWWPAECVHMVPSGTGIKHHATGVEYTFPNGSVTRRDKCDRPTPSRVRPGANASVTDHAYPIIFWGKHGALQKLTATYNVPAAPATQDGQTIFWWFGVEPTSAADVLQPVLGWNGFNMPEWTFASWNCCPAGHTHYAPPIKVAPGDTLFGALDGTGGDGYEIVSSAKGVTTQSVLRANDETPQAKAPLPYPAGRGRGVPWSAPASPWQVMPLLAMETYDVGGAPHCDLLPAGPLLLENLAATPPVTSWGADEPQGWSAAASCGWDVALRGGTLSATPPGTRAAAAAGVEET